MLSLVNSASDNDWETVRQLDNHRTRIVKLLQQTTNLDAVKKANHELVKTIIKLDKQLIEISDNALQLAKSQLNQLNNNAKGCSEYAKTQSL